MNTEKQELSFKQDFINHFIWLIIINLIFAYFGKQMERGTITTIGTIVWFVAGFFLFGFLFAFTKVLKKKINNTILSFIASFIFMGIINFILLAIVP